MLLTGLRHVHRMSAGVSLDSEVIAHTAQAMKDREFLILAEGCHPETLRQMRWANAMVKVTAAQVRSPTERNVHLALLVGGGRLVRRSAA